MKGKNRRKRRKPVKLSLV